jgi:ADP-L-glycero-D-manno-heptose 6-epimerase
MPQELRDKYQYFTQAELVKLRKAGYEKEFMPIEKSVKDYVSYLKNDSYL